MANSPDNNDSEGFVSRWSRRKSEIAEKEPITSPEILKPLGDSQSEGQLVAMIDPAQSDAIEQPVLTDEDMPTLDSLNQDSDFSPFMSPGVSEALRKLALRKLFQGARFNIRDGLDDYDDDFRNFAGLGDLVTCDMKHQIEMQEERKRKEEEEAREAEALKMEKDETIETEEESENQKSEPANALVEENPIDPKQDIARKSKDDVSDDDSALEIIKNNHHKPT